jgi:hypothetical protein
MGAFASSAEQATMVDNISNDQESQVKSYHLCMTVADTTVLKELLAEILWLRK